MLLNLSLTAHSLQNVAGLFKGISDPFVVAFVNNNYNEEVGRTEVVKNDCSPAWGTLIKINYEMGTEMRLNLCIFDFVSGESPLDLKKHKSMGSASFDLLSLIRTSGTVLGKKLRKGGRIYVHGEVASQDTSTLRLQVRGLRLSNKEGVFKKADPYFLIRRAFNTNYIVTPNDPPPGCRDEPAFANVFRSDIVKSNLNPVWQEHILSVADLCNGSYDALLLIQVFDAQKKSPDLFMGQTTTNLRALLDKPKLALMDGKKVQQLGTITVLKAELGNTGIRPQEAAPAFAPPAPAPAPSPAPAPAVVPNTTSSSPPTPTWLDYINSGCEIQLQIACDFTASNGDPRIKGTLHAFNDGNTNEYQCVLRSIGSALLGFDDDKKVPFLGFGAKINGQVNHCFGVLSLSGDAEVDCNGNGSDGLLHAYNNFMQSGICMSSPTVFSEVIGTAIAKAASAQESKRRLFQQCYSVLLIVTDGFVDESDLRATQQLCSLLPTTPLSIVIVGVGSASLTRPMASIPNTNFVDFRSVYREGGRELLNKKALEGVGEDLVKYFQKIDMQPKESAPMTDESAKLYECDDHDLFDEFNDGATNGKPSAPYLSP